MKKALTYGSGLIALYLVVVNYAGTQGVIKSSANGGIGIIKAFQGRG